MLVYTDYGYLGKITEQTFLQGRLLVLLQTLHCDCLKPDTGCRILLQHVPHILLAEHEQVAITDRSHAGRPSIACGGET